MLGVLVISGEYSTGMIRSSFMAAPKRLPVLWAKLAVFCSVIFVTMLVSGFISFFITQAIVAAKDQQHTLGDPHALRVVIGNALFLTVLGAFSVGLGALVRNTAGGIALFVFLLFVLPGITAILPHTTADKVNPYLPLNAGSAVATSTFDPGPHLAPWNGFGVFCIYCAIAIAAAAIGLLAPRRLTTVEAVIAFFTHRRWALDVLIVVDHRRAQLAARARRSRRPESPGCSRSRSRCRCSGGGARRSSCSA